MKIKIRKADAEYSRWLRALRGNKCERCGVSGEVRKLECSHFWGRGNECTRFDEENTDVLCFTDHAYFGANPNEYVEWKKKRMSEQKYKMLMVRANLTCKKDDAKVLLWLKNQFETH